MRVNRFRWQHIPISFGGGFSKPVARYVVNVSAWWIGASFAAGLYKIAGRLEPRRPPMKDEGTETAFRLDQCKHFRKSKHLLRSEVNRCDQSSIELHLRLSTSTSYWWVDRSTCLASRISTQKESFPGSEFKPASIWTCWMLIDRQMQSAFIPELHRWISKLTARHLHHQDIFWSPW